MSDLFSSDNNRKKKPQTYLADDIEVLEGLEAVRLRPGMYIGGTDKAALHHLATEILDNAMDEAVAGFAGKITFRLEKDNFLQITDNGRGIPVDPHPKFKDKSALEVILTTLHAGGKFKGKAYTVAGGLHGVGSSVVNALSVILEAEIIRDGRIRKQTYVRGKPSTPLTDIGPAPKGITSGTAIRFKPDPEIFGDLCFDPETLYKLCRAKASLYRGVTVLWSAEPSVIEAAKNGKNPKDIPPPEAVLHFPKGPASALEEEVPEEERLFPEIWAEQVGFTGENKGQAEWAVAWLGDAGSAELVSYCNTIVTPLGGTHEAGFKTALLKGLRSFAEATGQKRALVIQSEDIAARMAAKLSLFTENPQFQGQTKEKLTSPEAARLTENAVRNRFEHFLAADPKRAELLLSTILAGAEARLSDKNAKVTSRKSATKRLRLPGKLTDCSREDTEDTEIFLVEGDSAGGSAKQARNRETQAVLPLRGKILNVAGAGAGKLSQNKELQDLIEALGCGSGSHFSLKKLRYGRVIIMTDADVDGAHIASLLMTFFFRELPGLVEAGRLYLACPPLYRLVQGAKSAYAMTDEDRDIKLKTLFKNKEKVEISRFKGLGEMPAPLLKQTTMDPRQRRLIRVTVPDNETEMTAKLVEDLMGKRPETRLEFIRENAPHFMNGIDV